MKIIATLLLLASTTAFAQTLDPYRPSARDEYAGRLRVEQEQRERQYQLEQARREQEQRNQQMQQQYPGYQGIPYQVGGSGKRY